MRQLFYTIPIYAFWLMVLVAGWSRLELKLWRRRALRHLAKWSEAVADKDKHKADFHYHQWQGMYAQDKAWFDQHAENR